MKLYEPQPAPLIYAYSGGWQVMRYVAENVFSRTGAAARTWTSWGEPWKDKAEDEENRLFKYWYWCMVVGFALAGLAQYISAMLLVSIFVVIQFTLLVLWVLASSVTIAILAAGNFLYGSYYKIFFRCPDCHEQMKIPVFVCPVCATDHTRLWPSIYGVFHHRCLKCNTRLPTLDLIGRTNLVQKCTACNRPFNKEIGRLINIHIPVIGGPSTGKSNYIVMATREFIESYAPPREYTVEFPDDNHQRDYESNVRRLASGTELPKTPDIVPQAYNMAIKKANARMGKIVYVYDAAGEAYLTEDNATLQTYYRYVHGIVFIIDPFSIQFQQQMHEEEISEVKAALRPSTLNVMEAYERMLAVLESSMGLKRDKKFPYPIAVVVTKTDALDLEDQIGYSAAQNLMRDDPRLLLEEDAVSILVERFLVENQLGNLIRDIRLQFQNVKFFSCSALGRMPDATDTTPYEPKRVLAPLLWLMGQLQVTETLKERVHTVDVAHRASARARGNTLEAFKFYYWGSLKPQ